MHSPTSPSEDTIKDLNEETFSALRDECPAPHPDNVIPPAPIPSQMKPVQVSADEVGRDSHFFPLVHLQQDLMAHVYNILKT